MQLIELTAHCNTCHDLLTVTGLAIDSIGQRKQVIWQSPSYRVSADGTCLIHRQPGFCEHLKPCGGKLLLIGSQDLSRYHHASKSPLSSLSAWYRAGVA